MDVTGRLIGFTARNGDRAFTEKNPLPQQNSPLRQGVARGGEREAWRGAAKRTAVRPSGGGRGSARPPPRSIAHGKRTETGLIGAPADVGMVGGDHGPGFGLLAEGEPFIPAALEMEEGRERSAHGLQARIIAREEEGQGGGDAGPGRCEILEAVVLFVAVLDAERIGPLFQPVASLRHDLGLFLPQEVRGHGHEGAGLQLFGRDDERTVDQRPQRALDRSESAGSARALACCLRRPRRRQRKRNPRGIGFSRCGRNRWLGVSGEGAGNSTRGRVHSPFSFRDGTRISGSVHFVSRGLALRRGVVALR